MRSENSTRLWRNAVQSRIYLKFVETHRKRLNWSPKLHKLQFSERFLDEIQRAPLSVKCLHKVIGSNLYQTLFGHASPSHFQVCSVCLLSSCFGSCYAKKWQYPVEQVYLCFGILICNDLLDISGFGVQDHVCIDSIVTGEIQVGHLTPILISPKLDSSILTD